MQLLLQEIIIILCVRSASSSESRMSTLFSHLLGKYFSSLCASLCIRCVPATGSNPRLLWNTAQEVAKESQRSSSQQPKDRGERLREVWYYWCWWKPRGACNLFNKSRTVVCGAPELSCFLRAPSGAGGPRDQHGRLISSVSSPRQLRRSQRLGSLAVSRVFLLKFFVSFWIHYKQHNYISFSSLIDHISCRWWFTTWLWEEAEQRPRARAASPRHSRTAPPSTRALHSPSPLSDSGLVRGPCGVLTRLQRRRAPKSAQSWVSEHSEVFAENFGYYLEKLPKLRCSKPGAFIYIWLL